MLFNSTVFLQFFTAFLAAYYVCRNNLVHRNLLIVAASWLFYGWWDYRFLGLLIFSGCFDYAVGRMLGMQRWTARRRVILASSIIINLALLGFFKYFDFFVDSAAALMQQIGIPFETKTLGIILPVGISFYTFQSLSYVIDVYRGRIQPTQSLLTYLAFVSFFPQLVAGPIQRGHDLLPQLERTLEITACHIARGWALIILGLFKKVVVADNLAPLVDMVFSDPNAAAPSILLGTVAFGFQIYGDFSGYSDIAIGLASLLGFGLQPNFRLPYLATDLRDFWRRWHISLSFWLRDYLYISLGGNRQGPSRTTVNVFITMVLGGLWHGPAWNFVIWGAWHGAGLAITQWWQQRLAKHRPMPVWAARGLTLGFVFCGWLVFRAGSGNQVLTLGAALGNWQSPPWLASYCLSLLLWVAPLAALDLWQHRRQNSAVLADRTWPHGIIQSLLVLAILLFWEKRQAPFIYFQF